MKIHHSIPAACAWAVFLLAGGAAPAADAHEHGAGEAGHLTLDHGRKWSTDAPLREGMAAIRAALAARHEAIHQGTLSVADFQALGATVETRVAAIVASCRLEPAADANLHLIIAELLAGAAAMQGRADAAPAAGAARAVQALDDYGRYFDHPGWQPPG